MRCLLLANCIIQSPKTQNMPGEKGGSNAFQCQCSQEYSIIHYIAKDSSSYKERCSGCGPVTISQSTDIVTAILHLY